MRSPVLKICVPLFLLTLLGYRPSFAQVLAFPGAEGFGAYAKGGRGGDVYHVTNLNASGAGSFSYGVTTGVPASGRTIVFDVSGYASISGTVRITTNKITLAGQTAPGDGFGLKDGTFLVSGDDIIIRHMRFRDGKSADAINLDSNSANTIFDHSDAMFSNDENMSTFGSPPENLTFQWGLNAWGLESHSCGGLWDMSHTTCSHSLWAHNHTRNPKARPGILEWINNVTFDWDIGFIMGDSESNANWTTNARGCYFIGPPGNTQSKAFVKGTVATNGRPNYTLYLDNCLSDTDGDGILNGTNKGYAIVEGSSYTNGQLPAPVTGDTRYYQPAAPLTGSTAGVIIDSPLLAYKKIVSNAGPLRLDYDPARLLRDEVAELLITNLVTQRRYHVNSPTKTNLPNGGFGNLVSSPAPVDTDQDGIPDYFETAVTRTGDVWSTTADDHNTVVVNSGTAVSEPTFFPANTVVGTAATDKYTHLEEYLHFLAMPHGVMARSTVAVPSSIDIDLRKYTRGFANTPVFTITNVLNGTATLQPDGYTLRFSPPTTNFTGLTVPYGRAKFDFTVTDADSSTWTQRFDLLVSANALPRNLTWKGDGSTNAWDTSTLDWTRNGSATAYADPDYVSFDDTGSNSPNLNLTATLAPTAINIDSTKNYSFTGSGLINGATSLRKFGTGTLTIATPNAYSGGTVIDGTTLFLNNGGSIGPGTLTLQNGATFTNNYPVANSASIGALTVPAGSSATFNSGNRLAVNGALTGGGALTYNVQTTVSRFDLKGVSNAFSGPVSFTGSGGVRVYLSSGFGGFDAATVDLGGSVNFQPQTGTAGNTFAFGSLTGASSTAELRGGSVGAVTYSIGALNQSTTFAGLISGSSVVNKTGTGTLTLSGANTYTGVTGLNAGTLVVNGSLGTTPVTVASGTTLAGTGTLGGTVSVASGGRITPGNPGGVGTFTATALTLVAGSNIPFDLTSNPASGNDRITLTGGALTVTGSPNLSFNLLNGLLGPGTYPIISGGSNTSTLNPTFTTNLPVGARQGFVLNTATRGTVNLVVTNTAATLAWLGSPTTNWDTNNTVTWTGAPDGNNKFLTFDAVTFGDKDSNAVAIASGNVTITGSVRPRSLTVDNTALNYNFNGGAIAGGGSLIKNGSGTLTLNPTPLVLSSTTTVGTTVTVDTTNLGVGMNVLGSGIPGGTTIASITNATTLVLSQAATTAATVNLSYTGNSYSGGTFLNGGTIVLATDNANSYALGTGPVTFGNGTTLTMYNNQSGDNTAAWGIVVPTGVTATLNADSRVNLSGSLVGSGTLNLRIPYIRTNILGDWSAFTGTINLSTDADGGNFRYGTDYGYPGFPLAGINLPDKVTMSYIGILSGGAGTTIPFGEISGAATAGLSGGPTVGRALTLRVGSRNTDATFAGSIGEQGGVTGGNTTSYVKTGTGTWTLSGTCLYNGSTTVEQGTLRILSSLTSPQPIDVSSGAVLSLGGGSISVDSVNIHTGASFNGYGTITGDLNNEGSSTTTSGRLTVTGSLTNAGTMFFANGSSLEITGDMDNGGTLSLVSGSQLTGTGSIVNNGIIDMMTGLQSLPANFINNGIVLDFNRVIVQSASLSGTTMTVSIRGFQGHSYQLQRTASLTTATWVNLGTLQPGTGPLTGSGTTLNLVDANATGGSFFYRILVTP